MAEPFALTPHFEIDLEIFARDTRTSLRIDELISVDPLAMTLGTGSGSVLGFDELIIATGAVPMPSLGGALVFRGSESVSEFRHLLYQVERGEIGSLVFAVPDGARWLLPIYELALMTAVFARARLAQPELFLVTPEAIPLQPFGDEAGRELAAALDEWGIALIPEHRATRFERPHLETDRNFTITADAVVTVPRLRGPAIDGLPADGDGFVETSSHGRVARCDGVFAAGDATTTPLKHGGIAAQQADAVAEQIASDHGMIAEPGPFRPSLDGVLLRGEAAVHLHRFLTSGAGSRPRDISGDVWWPFGKVAAPRLASYLADRAGLGTTSAAVDSDRLTTDLKAIFERESQTRVGDNADEGASDSRQVT